MVTNSRNNMTTTDLYKKYYDSGINGSPIITTKELLDLKHSLEDIVEFMRYRGDNSVGICLWMDIERINRIIEARKD